MQKMDMCVAVCCSVLQCVHIYILYIYQWIWYDINAEDGYRLNAGHSSMHVLRHWYDTHLMHWYHIMHNMLMCCCVLQCVAVSCNVCIYIYYIYKYIHIHIYIYIYIWRHINAEHAYHINVGHSSDACPAPQHHSTNTTTQPHLST